MSFEVFYDGECPLCAREISLLRWMDRYGRIRFTDIAAPDFHAETVGKDLDTLMGSIHGRTLEGTWVEGVEVFRNLYGAVGFGPLIPLTRLPGVRQVLDWGYRVFARNRLAWTGRKNCETGRCRVAV